MCTNFTHTYTPHMHPLSLTVRHNWQVFILCGRATVIHTVILYTHHSCHHCSEYTNLHRTNYILISMASKQWIGSNCQGNVGQCPNYTCIHTCRCRCTCTCIYMIHCTCTCRYIYIVCVHQPVTWQEVMQAN